MANNTTPKTAAQIAKKAEQDAQMKIRAFAGKGMGTITADLILDPKDKTTLRPAAPGDPALSVQVPKGTRGIVVQYWGTSESASAIFYMVQLFGGEKVASKLVSSVQKIVAGAFTLDEKKRASSAGRESTSHKTQRQKDASAVKAAHLENASVESYLKAMRATAQAELDTITAYLAAPSVELLHELTALGWIQHAVINDAGKNRRPWKAACKTQNMGDNEYREWVGDINALRVALGQAPLEDDESEDDESEDDN